MVILYMNEENTEESAGNYNKFKFVEKLFEVLAWIVDLGGQWAINILSEYISIGSVFLLPRLWGCLLYTSDAADE